MECGQRSFATSERLTKHLKICEQSNSVECNKCGKGYSNQSHLSAHIKDVHDTDLKWNCQFCDANYKSEGGYYGHLQMKHGVGRNGKKLSTALIKKMVEEYKGQDSGLHSKEKDKNAKNISESKENSVSQESEGKSADENIPANTPNTDGVSKTSLSSSACAEMTHKCPFPSCCDLELQK